MPAQRRLTVGLVLAVTFVAFEALAVATILPVVGATWEICVSTGGCAALSYWRASSGSC